MILDKQQQERIRRIENLFFRHGIKAITMDDVARELGISKKTLYQIVPSKKDLVQMIVRGHMEIQQETCKQIRLEAKDALDEMLGIIESDIHDFQKIKSNMFYELQRYYRPAWNTVLEYGNSFMMPIIKENLEWGQREGIYRKELNIEIVTRIHMAQTFSLFDNHWFPIGSQPLHSVVEESFMLYLHGLLSTKGRELLAKKLEKSNDL